MTKTSESIWHTKDEVPENGSKIIIITDIGIKLSGSFNMRTLEEGAIVNLPDYEFCWWKNVDKWVNLSIFVNQSTSLKADNERLRKALDIIAHNKGDGQAICREIDDSFINVRDIAKVALGEDVKPYYGFDKLTAALE